MSAFAAVLTRTGDRWRAREVDVEQCESVDDLADLARDVPGEVRLLVVEEDDRYAILVRADADDDPRVFLSDGHAADDYAVAAVVADEVDEIGSGDLDGLDPELLEDAPAAHDSAPYGDAAVVQDLGTSSADLLGLCASPSTLPIDLIVAVAEKAGAVDAFESVRA